MTAFTASRSLVSLRAGESAEIDHILFDSVRDHCARAGVREGTRVIGRGVSGGDVEIEMAEGRVVHLDGVLARFIQLRERQDARSA